LEKFCGGVWTFVLSFLLRENLPPPPLGRGKNNAYTWSFLGGPLLGARFFRPRPPDSRFCFWEAALGPGHVSPLFTLLFPTPFCGLALRVPPFFSRGGFVQKRGSRKNVFADKLGVSSGGSGPLSRKMFSRRSHFFFHPRTLGFLLSRNPFLKRHKKFPVRLFLDSFFFFRRFHPFPPPVHAET